MSSSRLVVSIRSRPGDGLCRHCFCEHDVTKDLFYNN